MTKSAAANPFAKSPFSIVCSFKYSSVPGAFPLKISTASPSVSSAGRSSISASTAAAAARAFSSLAAATTATGSPR